MAIMIRLKQFVHNPWKYIGMICTLMLGVHARESYCSQFACLSVCVCLPVYYHFSAAYDVCVRN